MQRVMIVSDTHGKIGNLAEAIDREGRLDMLIHLGDFEGDDEAISEMCGCKLMLVPGNNDFFSALPKEIETEIAGKKVLLTHGHYYYVSLDLATIRNEAVARGIDIVMFGHIHRPVIEVDEDVVLINPGSLSYPRQADKKCTYIMMTISDEGEFSFELKSI